MTKGKNRSLMRRKLRRATKNTDIDFGSRIADRHIAHRYGAVANQHKLKDKPYQNMDR